MISNFINCLFKGLKYLRTVHLAKAVLEVAKISKRSKKNIIPSLREQEKKNYDTTTQLLLHHDIRSNSIQRVTDEMCCFGFRTKCNNESVLY